MENNLGLLEEFDIESKFQSPHLMLSRKLPYANKNIALLVLRKKEDEILLINSTGFNDIAVLAGLNEKHIEFFSKHAPVEYKEELMGAFKDQEKINSVWEIAKAMDEDAGDGSTKNQERVKNVIQYIQDNRVAFQV